MFLSSIPTENKEDDVFIVRPTRSQAARQVWQATSEFTTRRKIAALSTSQTRWGVVFWSFTFDTACIFQGIFHYSKEEWLAPAEGLEVAREDEGGGGGLAPKRRRTVLPPSRQVQVLPSLAQRGMRTEDTMEVDESCTPQETQELKVDNTELQVEKTELKEEKANNGKKF